MKRKTFVILGNIFMVLGLVFMICGAGLTIVSHVKDIALLSGDLASLPIAGIFIGAFVWLVGARISGREKVADRYWWIKHYDNRRYRHKHL